MKIWVAFLVLVALFATSCSVGSTGSVNVDSATFMQLIQDKNEDTYILDVRTAQEYDAGHIPEALNIDYYASDFKEQLSQLDKDKTYLIYCRSGSRSGNTVSIMQDLGFTSIKNLNNGFNDWSSKGYPSVR